MRDFSFMNERFDFMPARIACVRVVGFVGFLIDTGYEVSMRTQSDKLI